MGSTETTTLAKARELAQEQRELLRKGIDPVEHQKAQRGRLRLEAAKSITFKECADAYIAANRAGWKSAKHADQWFASFNETKRGTRKFPALTALINDLPVSAIDTGLVLKVLEPIWTKTPETAARVRGRIELVLDWAKVRGYREGENPARWRDHLKQASPGAIEARPRPSRRRALCRDAGIHGRAPREARRLRPRP